MSVAPVPSQVLDHWPLVAPTVTPITHGHINQTFLVESGISRFVLQRVAPIFGPEIHADIHVVTQHLLRHGVPTPMLVMTEDARLYVEHDGIWRLLTFAPGHTHLRVTNPALAASAAGLLARFHGALVDLDYQFQNQRTGIHDTARHAAGLEDALEAHRAHPAHGRVARLAEELWSRWRELQGFAHLPDRPVHGDPKISNVLFDELDHAHCLVDLDTLGRMPVVLELGDALRSWCNDADEDGAGARFNAAIFEAGLGAYVKQAGDTLSGEERDAILDGTETIALELGMRFAADALNESYFGWDRERFARAADHNVIRATNQLALATSIRDQRRELERIVASL